MEPGSSDPLALGPGEGEAVGSSVIKADRPELSLFEFETALGGANGTEPDDACFERHDVYDVD
jgi:hypothetical protein